MRIERASASHHERRRIWLEACRSKHSFKLWQRRQLQNACCYLQDTHDGPSNSEADVSSEEVVSCRKRSIKGQEYTKQTLDEVRDISGLNRTIYRIMRRTSTKHISLYLKLPVSKLFHSRRDHRRQSRPIPFRATSCMSSFEQGTYSQKARLEHVEVGVFKVLRVSPQHNDHRTK